MALARALAVEPKVLLLDEPFGALDARVRAELRAWLRRLHDEVHVTTVFVTHDQEEAMEVADQVAVMNHGRIEQVGRPRELYEQPVDRVRDELRRPREPRRRDVGASARPRAARPQPRTARTRRGSSGSSISASRCASSSSAHDGEQLWAQVTRDRCEELGLEAGQIVYVRTSRERVFALDSADASTRSASDVSSSTPRMLRSELDPHVTAGRPPRRCTRPPRGGLHVPSRSGPRRRG